MSGIDKIYVKNYTGKWGVEQFKRETQVHDCTYITQAAFIQWKTYYGTSHQTHRGTRISLQHAP